DRCPQHHQGQGVQGQQDDTRRHDDHRAHGHIMPAAPLPAERNPTHILNRFTRTLGCVRWVGAGRRSPQPSGGAVDSRTTRCVASSTRLVTSDSPRARLTTVPTALRPISAIGWCTVVSRGVLTWASTVSSKPTTDNPPGTSIPSRRAAATTPVAHVSFPAKIAVGGSAEHSIAVAASNPWSKE